MTVRVASAQDKKIHGKAAIAIQDHSNGYVSPVYESDLDRLDEEDQRKIKNFEVK